MAATGVGRGQLLRDTHTRLPIEYGECELYLYKFDNDDPRSNTGKDHMAAVFGDVENKEDVLVRVHSECFTGDVLGSRRCDCGEQLARGLSMCANEGTGIVLYLRQEGRGIGLPQKLRAYNLQDLGYDTVDANLLLGHGADQRDYGVAAAMLADLGVRSIRLITNNPSKINKLTSLGVQVNGRVELHPLVVDDHNAGYLETKRERMGHKLLLPGDEAYQRSLNTENVSGMAASAATPAPTTSSSFPLRLHAASSAELAADNANGVGNNGDGYNNNNNNNMETGALGSSACGGACATTCDGACTRGDCADDEGPSLSVEKILASAERPFVTLSYAQSLDGSISFRRGEPLGISCDESLVFTHTMRSLHDGILVGVGTVLADDPRLNVRLASGSSPQPIVLDSSLQTPLSARILRNPRSPWILCNEHADPRAAEALEAAGAVVVVVPSGPDGLNLEAALREVFLRGVRHVMVEGGATVISSFLRCRLVDHLVVTVAPVLVGGLKAVNDIATELPGPGGAKMATYVLPELRNVSHKWYGTDLVIAGKPCWEGHCAFESTFSADKHQLRMPEFLLQLPSFL